MIYSPLLGEIVTLSAIVILVALHDISAKKHHSMLNALVFVLMVTAGLSILAVGQQTSITNEVSAYTMLHGILKLSAILGTALVIYYTKAMQPKLPLEFYIFILFSLLGSLVLICAGSLLTLFLGLELASMPLYALIAIYRDSKQGSEAAIKYFIISAIASAIMLYGISIIYALAATITLQEISSSIALAENSSLLAYGLGFLLIFTAGAVKLALFPYHSWAPDVYTGAPVCTTLFIATIPKIAAFTFLIKLLLETMDALLIIWQPWLFLVGFCSVIIGSVSALMQQNVSRLIAYAAVSNMGFLSLGLACATVAGNAASVFYLIVYCLASLGIFAVLGLLNYQSVDFTALKGLYYRSPLLAGVLSICLLAMLGIPPFAGFISKLLIISSLFAEGLNWLVVAVLLLTALGAFYYLQIVKEIYFYRPAIVGSVNLDLWVKLLLSMNAGALLYLGVYPQPLINIITQALA